MGIDARGFLGGSGMSAKDWAMGETRQFRIADVVQQRLGKGDDAEEKLCLEFQGDHPWLALNKTNLGRIITALGADTDGWIGHRVEVVCVQVKFQGRPCPGLQISRTDVDGSSAPRSPSRPNNPQPPPPPPHPDRIPTVAEEEIPF